jgi:hypothetical protein
MESGASKMGVAIIYDFASRVHLNRNQGKKETNEWAFALSSNTRPRFSLIKICIEHSSELLILKLIKSDDVI